MTKKAIIKLLKSSKSLQITDNQGVYRIRNVCFTYPNNEDYFEADYKYKKETRGFSSCCRGGSFVTSNITEAKPIARY